MPVDRITPAHQVRTTLLVSAIQAFRARGLYDAYVGHLNPQARLSLLSLIAGQWAPIGLAEQHYRAADRLGLSVDAIEAIGSEVADRINKSALSVMVKMGKEAGATPWSALGHAHRLTNMNWRGSDVRVLKLGPKEARYDWLGQPCAAVPYFVVSFGGFLRSLTSLFCTRTYARVVTDRCSPTQISYRLSWV